MTRTAILMGRMHKLGNLQSKLTNLKDGIIIGDGMTPELKEKFTSEKFRKYADAKIKKTELLKLKIALAIYDDLIT